MASKGPTPAYVLTCGVAFRAQLVAYPASRTGDSTLVNLCDVCAPKNLAARLGRREYCKNCNATVAKPLKGYELPTGGYVLLTDDEVRGAAGEKSKEMSVEAVLPWSSIDSYVLNDSTFIGPADQISVEPFELIRQVLIKQDWCLLVKFMGRTGRDKYGLVRNHNESLMLQSIFLPNDVRDFQSQNKANVQPVAALSKATLDMGRQLLASYETTFPLIFPTLTDSYEERVQTLVKFRQDNPNTAFPVTATAAPVASSSLEAALKASLEARGSLAKRLVTIDDGDAVRKPPVKAEDKKPTPAKKKKSA